MLHGRATEMNVHPAKESFLARVAIRANSVGDVRPKDDGAETAKVICRRLSPETPAGSLATASIHDHPQS